MAHAWLSAHPSKGLQLLLWTSGRGWVSPSAAHSSPSHWGGWVKSFSWETGHGLSVPLPSFSSESVPVQGDGKPIALILSWLWSLQVLLLFLSQRQGQASNLHLVLVCGHGLALLGCASSSLPCTSIGGFWCKPALVPQPWGRRNGGDCKWLHGSCLVTSEASKQTWCRCDASVGVSGAPSQDDGNKA